MSVAFLRERFAEFADDDAMVWRQRPYSYAWLIERWSDCAQWLEGRVPAGVPVSVEADFSPTAVAMFLALAERRNVIVPLTASVASKAQEFRSVANVAWRVVIDRDDRYTAAVGPGGAGHPAFDRLAERGAPGLILFSSGTSGRSKAAVHDLSALLEKFTVRRHRRTMIAFLLFDHIGGLNTLLYSLSNGGRLVTVESRDPDDVLEAVARHRVDVLPVSPTFVHMAFIAGSFDKYDLTHLQVLTYGTEPMPERTLRRLHDALPHVDLQQTYGLSELGILRAKSRSSDSLWVKVGGEGVETRIVDGILQVKTRSAMLGYLNAPSPFTEDGWFDTGDSVEQDGEWLRILGRESELINVGGQKVHPAAVEGVIATVPGVVDVSVYGQSNAITGHIVAAQVHAAPGVDTAELAGRIRSICAAALPRYQVPVRITFDDAVQHTERFKKRRSVGV